MDLCYRDEAELSRAFPGRQLFILLISFFGTNQVII